MRSNPTLLWMQACGLVCLALLASCRTPLYECGEIYAEHNLGSDVNSPYDDFAPLMYNYDRLLFTSNRPAGDHDLEFVDTLSAYGENIYAAGFEGGLPVNPILIEDPPLNTLRNDGSAGVYIDPRSNRVELYFARFRDDEQRSDADLFMTTYENGRWTPAVSLGPRINSPDWDAQPAISPDGNFLVFSSDRPNRFDESDAEVNDIDLYVSRRLPDGSWAAPVRLSNHINSESDDITPAFGIGNDLYYASRTESANQNYDIAVARNLGAGQWGQGEFLPWPFNDPVGNDHSPAPWADSLYFASDRVGGCGGYDLYAERVCEAVIVRGVVSSAPEMHDREKILVTDESGIQVAALDVSYDGAFEYGLQPGGSYTFTYDNPCNPAAVEPITVDALCSVDPTIIRMGFDAPPSQPGPLDLPDYAVPFFVTGYYKPSTPENIHDLRLKFAYNLIGEDSTSYIEFPGDKYDDIAEKVETALERTSTLLEDYMRQFLDECWDGTTQIVISVEGFADPRPIFDKARYADEAIFDPGLNMFVDRGERVDNEILSRMRAYFTARELIARLERSDVYRQVRDRVQFEINGTVFSEADPLPYELQRRIVINAMLRE